MKDLMHARVTILLPFVLSLVLQIMLLGSVFVRGEIRAATFQGLVLTLLAVYAIPLGTIAGGVFGVGNRGGRVPASTLGVAMGFGILWNLLLLGRTAYFAFASEDLAGDWLTYIETVAAASMFLITAALAFFFSKRQQE